MALPLVLMGALVACDRRAPPDPFRLFGRPAPTLSALPLGDGAAHAVLFQAAHCDSCPRLAAALRSHKTRDRRFWGLALVSIDREISPLRTQAYNDHLAVSDTQREVAAAYRITSVPTILLIDRNGIVRAIYTDAIDLDKVRDALRFLLNEPSAPTGNHEAPNP